MKKRIIFLGTLVLLLMVWVFSAAIAEQDIFISDSGSIINFQVDLPSGPPEEGGFYSYGPQIYLQGFSYEVQAPRPEWSVVSSNGGPKLTLEGGNKASFRQDSNETYVAGTSYNYTVSCVWNGTTYTKDYQVNFIKSALPAGEIGISIAQLDVMTSPATIGSWTSCEKLEMVMISGKKYAVSANVGVTDSFSQYSIIESVYGSQCQKEPDNNPKYQNEDGTSIFGDASSHIQVVGARQPGRYSGNVIVQYQGTNLACYIPNTLTITDESGSIPNPSLDYNSSELTWYTGLPDSNQGQGGAYSKGSMGEFRIPWDVRDYTDTNVHWSMMQIGGSGTDLFELEEHDAFSVSVAPKNGSAITDGEYKYKLTAEYKGKTYEATLRIHTEPGTAMPTQLDVRAFATDVNGSTLGREIPVTNGEVTVYKGEIFFLNVNTNEWINFNYYCNNNGIETIGSWERESDRERGIYSNSTRKLIANTAGTYTAEASMNRDGSNFAVSSPFTIRVVDQGSEPAVTLQIMGDYPWTDGSQETIYFPVYVNLGRSGMVWQWDQIIKVHVTNYENMFDRYHGVPTWTVSRTDQNGGELHYSWNPDDAMGVNGRAYGYLTDLPTQAMTAELTVTCTWGGQTASKVIRIEAIEPNYNFPTGMDNLPDVIETQVNKTLTLAPTLAPSGWNYNGYSPSCFVGGNLGAFAKQNWGADQPTYTVQKAGVFRDNIGIMVGTIMVTKEVTFKVKDESGVIPKDPPILSALDGNEVTYFIGAIPEERPVIHYETAQSKANIAGIAIRNYVQIKDQYTGDPVFTADADDPTAQFHVDLMGSKDGATLFVDDIPTTTKDVTYTVTLNWDGVYAEQEILVHFVPAPSLPDKTTMVANETVIVKTGQDITFRNLFKKMWSIEGYGFSIVSLAASSRDKNGIDREYGYAGFRYFAKDPGVYTGEVIVRCNNILWPQKFTLKVTDVNGNIPAEYGNECGNGVTWVLDDGVLTICKTGDGDGKMTSHPWTDSSESIVEVMIEEGVTSICEDAFAGCSRMSKITIPALIREFPGAFTGCDALSNITYGGIQEDWQGFMIFTDDGPGYMPVKNASVTCRTSEKITETTHPGYSFSVTCTKPDGSFFTADEGSGRYQCADGGQILITMNADDMEGYTKTYRIETNVHRSYVNPEEDGKATVTETFRSKYDGYRAFYRGIAVYEPVNSNNPVLVAQGPTCVFEAGEEEQEIGELEILNYQNSYTYYINDLSAIPDEQGRFSREGMLIQFRLDASTYQNLKEKLGGTPVWSCETVQGDTAFTMQPLGSSGQIANLAFASRPTEADAATVKVRCTWGSLSDEKEVSIEAKALPGGLPEGITFSFGDTLTIRKGQMLPSVTSFASFINNWSIPGESQKYGYSYTPRDAVSGNRINTPGEYKGYAELNYANIVCGRSYTIIVTDEDGTLDASLYEPVGSVFTLPDSLTTIESEAFAGTSIRQIDIPETVTSIAEDAFDGCGLVAIYAHNLYVLEWAVDHGFVALVD